MKGVFIKFPVYSDASPPRPGSEGELKPSHSAHLRPLRRGGSRVGISESQAENQVEKAPVFGVQTSVGDPE